MAFPKDPRRLIVNADDFGLSSAVNAAVERAHREGILTTASLMTGGAACEDAVRLATQLPRLGVGLHLTLVCGQAVSPPATIPHLAGPNGSLPANPVWAGLRFFFLPGVRRDLGREVEAQFARFAATGLPLDHVNGHLHLHLHPAVLGRVLELADQYQVKSIRLTRDPLPLNLQLASGAWGYRLSHALVFGLLSAWAGRRIRRRGLAHTQRVYGLLQNARVDEPFVLGLLRRLPAGDSELYSHPSMTAAHRHETEALCSREARAEIQRSGIELIRYQDLTK